MQMLIASIALLFSMLSLSLQGFVWVRGRRPQLIVIQRGSDITNALFSIEGGGTVLMAELSVINNSPTAVAVIRHYDVNLEWNDPDFEFLSDPREAAHPQEKYSIPGTTLIFPRSEVLNHRRYEEGKLGPGETISGLIFCFGPVPIPACFVHGAHITLNVSVLDQSNRRHSAPFEFRVDRFLTRFE